MLKITATFAPQLAKGVTIVGIYRLEITLPCTNCRRNGRTIIYETIGQQGMCTPAEKCSGCPAVLRSIDLTGHAVSWHLEYAFQQFTDAKDGKVGSFSEKWARVNLQVKCGRCGFTSYKTSQGNLLRPLTMKCSACSRPLWVENSDPTAVAVSGLPLPGGAA